MAYEFYGFRIQRPERKEKQKEKKPNAIPLKKLPAPRWSNCSRCNSFTKVEYENRFNENKFYCQKCAKKILEKVEK